MRQINTKGLQLIEEFEGLSLKPYLCQAGVPTIGIGTTRYYGVKKVSISDEPISLNEAFELLRFDLQPVQERIDRFITENGLKLGDNKFSALVSFAYNVGVDAVINKEKSMAQALISENPEAIRKAFLAYDKYTKIVNGKKVKAVSNGLKRRREAEVKLFFS